MSYVAMVLGFIGVAVMALACFMLIRNEAVFRVREHFIWNAPDCLRAYNRLPEYDEMLESPKYWLLWTVAHWQAWLDRQEAA